MRLVLIDNIKDTVVVVADRREKIQSYRPDEVIVVGELRPDVLAEVDLMQMVIKQKKEINDATDS
jgi:hypothetical protein